MFSWCDTKPTPGPADCYSWQTFILKTLPLFPQSILIVIPPSCQVPNTAATHTHADTTNFHKSFLYLSILILLYPSVCLFQPRLVTTLQIHTFMHRTHTILQKDLFTCKKKSKSLFKRRHVSKQPVCGCVCVFETLQHQYLNF